MAVWGIGSFFHGTDNQFDNFIDGNFVCMLWKEDEVPEFYEMMREIQLGDIVYLKSFKRGSNEMHVNAIGIVTDTFKSVNSHIGYENCKNEIGVRWINKNPTLIIKVNSIYKQRKTTISKEYDKNVIEKIISKI
jgi:hypothetical protein